MAIYYTNWSSILEGNESQVLQSQSLSYHLIILIIFYDGEESNPVIGETIATSYTPSIPPHFEFQYCVCMGAQKYIGYLHTR